MESRDIRVRVLVVSQWLVSLRFEITSLTQCRIISKQLIRTSLESRWNNSGNGVKWAECLLIIRKGYQVPSIKLDRRFGSGYVRGHSVCWRGVPQPPMFESWYHLSMRLCFKQHICMHVNMSFILSKTGTIHEAFPQIQWFRGDSNQPDVRIAIALRDGCVFFKS